MYLTLKDFLYSSSGCFCLMFWYCLLNDLSVRNTFLTFERRKQCDNLASEITWHKIMRYASIWIYPLCGFKQIYHICISKKVALSCFSSSPWILLLFLNYESILVMEQDLQGAVGGLVLPSDNPLDSILRLFQYHQMALWKYYKFF